MGYFQDTGVLLLYGMTALLWIKADRSFIFVLLCTVVHVGNIFLNED